MMTSNRRYLTIGNQIIEGPREIFPPNSGYDWMEKDLSIYVRYYDDNRIQHVSLWSDSTMNKEDDYLKPIIRFVHWEGQNDLEKVRNKEIVNWPDIRIFIGNIKPTKFDKLNSGMMKIQESISKIQFVPLGISLKRDVAAIDQSDLSVDFEIWVRNGVQSISHYSPLLDDDDFSNEVIDLKNILLESIGEIDHSGWKERYDSPFETSSFDWDYEKINSR